MSRISIDVTDAQHQRLKAMAALQGKTIKDFVLESTLGAQSEDEGLLELEAILDKRLKKARAGGVGSRTVGDIVEQVRREAADRSPNA